MQKTKNCSTPLSRRQFLHGISTGTVAMMFVPGESGLRSDSAVEMDQRRAKSNGPSVKLCRSRLPILHKGDVVVVGGSLGGVAAALEFARKGEKVVLIEHRTYLGGELSATLKPWINLGKLAAGGLEPEPITACLKKMNLKASKGEIPLWMDACKVALEDLLLEAGVELVYFSLPTEAIVATGAIRGVVIGNKSGRQAVLGRLVLDTTSTAVVARVAGAEFEPEKHDDFHFIRMIEMEGVGPLEQTTLTVPGQLGIAGNELRVHQGYRFKSHVLVECPMELNLGRMNLEGLMQREIEARRRTMHVAAYLIRDVPAFQKAKLCICAYELDGLQTTRLAGPPPNWSAEFKGLDVEISDKNLDKVLLPLANFAGPVKGLWCLDEAARLEERQRDLLRDPVIAALAGAAFARAVLPMLRIGEINAAEANDYEVGYYLPHGLEVKLQDSPQRGRFYQRLTMPPVEVPVLREADVLVVGGGTCGATCASSASREGAKTALLEANSGLGGTGTIGGVCDYFFGRYWAGFALRNSKLVDEVHQTINWPTSSNKLNGGWNPEAKMYALLKDAQESGVEVFFKTITIAAVLSDNQVRGVVVATPYGPVAVLSKVTADTTGDGDVAAFAGAKFVYGAAGEHYPMWCYLAQYLEPTQANLAVERYGGGGAGSYENSVDVSNIDDLTRAVLVGRRLGPICRDHGPYLAPRESRHIIGDTVVTFTDLLRHRSFPDVVNIGAGTMDVHGKVTTDWLRMGLVAPILETELPYRALLPQGLENILVAAKAFSATHDAMFNLRNQPEMENLGGAVGVAAAYAVHAGVSPRRVDLSKVQKRLTEVGTLLPDMLTRRIKDEPYDEAGIKRLVNELDGRPLSAWWEVQTAREGTPNYRKKIPIVEICIADPCLAVPILKEEMAKASGDRQLRLAQALAMFGSNAGTRVLIAAIEQCIISGTAAPGPKSKVLEWPFDVLPTPPADLAYCLGMTRDPRALAIWDKLADLVRGEPEDFAAEFPWPFQYVDAICYGAMLLGDPAAVPILKKIHSRPALRNQSIKKGVEIDFKLDRRALVEVTLGRALASLGDPEGFETLIEYLDDNRANLAEFAHLTLQGLTGRDDGKDPQAWRQWLELAKGSLKPTPPLERVDK